MNGNIQLAEMAINTLTRPERDKLLERLTGRVNGSRIIKRKEFANRVGKTERWVDQLASRGVIRKIKMPGSVRAVGFLESEVEALLSGKINLERGQ